MVDPFISLENITLRPPGGGCLFDGTTWTMNTSEHWTLIGPTGGGKSILADAICRRVPVARGRIRFYFDDPPAPPRAWLNPGEIRRISAGAHRDLLRRYAGYHQARWQSFEGEDAPPVETFLGQPAAADGNGFRRRFAEAVDLLGIGHLLSRRILHLSNGEARKVLLARALMQAPKLLILDDPFSGLDGGAREALRRAIQRLLGAGGPQMLLLTSRSDELFPGMTHLLYVEDSRVAAQGPRKTVLREAVVSRFLAGPEKAPSPRPCSFPMDAGAFARIGASPLVDMAHTAVTYGATAVLRDITWRMDAGEHWAVLGPNGAGKTTLLSLILADNPQAYANRITLFGRRRGSGETIWDIKRRIGWVSPELHLYYGRLMTCREVVCSGFFDSVGLYRTCSPDQEALADRWLACLALGGLAPKPFQSVSAGEQRLVLIARALVKQPALLILDEPCQGLDAGHRRRILDLLDDLVRHTPVSLIFVTHHVTEMPAAVTHVLKLEAGRMVAAGPRGTVLGDFLPSRRAAGEVRPS